MFDNVGKTLMKAGKRHLICSYIVAGLCFIGSMFLFMEDAVFGCMGIAASLICLGWGYFVSLLIYGFGQLIQDTREIKNAGGTETRSAVALYDDLPDL